MKINVLASVCLTFLMGACNKPETLPQDPLFSAPVITGYKLIDMLGMPMGVVGNPNDRAKTESGGIVYQIMVFPIPAGNSIYLHMELPKDGSARQVWMKKAQASGTFTDNQNFPVVSMNANGNVFDTTIAGNEVWLSGSRFAEGYYRLYVSAAGQTLYENIVIIKQQ